MGFVDDVFHFVTDTADKVKGGAEKVEKIAKKVGLDRLAKLAGSVGKYAGKLAVAPGPVLSAGQKIIDKMRETTGNGDPERAAAYGDAGRAFHTVRDVLATAHPNAQWEGTGAKTYSQRNSQQENVTITIGDTDMEVATIISGEADQLVRLRRILDYNHNLLADVGQWTQWLGKLGPEGEAAQFAIEGFYVALALEQCTPEIWQMHNHANDNAAAIRRLHDVYQQAKSRVVIPDSAGDFDPHNTGPAPKGPGVPGTPPGGGAPPPGQPDVPSVPPAPNAPSPVPTPTNPAPPPNAPQAPPAVPAPSAPVRAAPATGAAPAASGNRPSTQKLSAPVGSNITAGAGPGASGGRAPVSSPPSAAVDAEQTSESESDRRPQ